MPEIIPTCGAHSGRDDGAPGWRRWTGWTRQTATSENVPQTGGE